MQVIDVNYALLRSIRTFVLILWEQLFRTNIGRKSDGRTSPTPSFDVARNILLWQPRVLFLLSRLLVSIVFVYSWHINNYLLPWFVELSVLGFNLFVLSFNYSFAGRLRLRSGTCLFWLVLVNFHFFLSKRFSGGRGVERGSVNVQTRDLGLTLLWIAVRWSYRYLQLDFLSLFICEIVLIISQFVQNSRLLLFWFLWKLNFPRWI